MCSDAHHTQINLGQIGIGGGGCLHPISMPATAEVPESLDKDKDKDKDKGGGGTVV
jgi:hypothetical protein